MDWTNAQILRLTTLIEGGRSFIQTAGEMCLTPGPVAGMARRLGLRGKNGLGNMADYNAARPAVAPKIRRGTPDPVPAAAPEPIPFTRRPTPCRWPLNDRRPWRFCEEPSEIGRPYCAAHGEMARSSG